MIKPVVQDDAFLADVKRVSADEFVVHLWWLGQSGFLIKYGNRYLLIDPYLSDSLTKKYSGTDKPHVRMSERVVDPARMDFVDVVTSSHNHTDHLDAETLVPLLKANPGMRIVTPAANRQFAAERLGTNPGTILAADEGKTINIAGFLITGIIAAHPQVERDEQGRSKYLGYVIQAGFSTIYHSGDTLWHDAIVEQVKPFKVDIALLPINGDRPGRRVAGNLDGPQAAKLAKAVRARVVIPSHYDMFEFNTASPDEFEQECQKIDQSYRVLRAGERFSSSEIRP
ncbi:MAG TPA: MBL fold metallo-hydrolase [Tepidisphaeraceae bacterium]|jgi:L-ascorbate metabolism protein UlaG (beta-lactamase superfamily)|nr:MBL fold metallo-hydrolase [Tepidisphaeraceae bacterium]